MSAAVEPFDRVEKDALRKTWGRINASRHCVLFDDFKDFVAWCAESGWTYGLKLKRIDRDGPFSRDNCTWEAMRGDLGALAICAQKWEAGVGPIREKLRPYLDALAKKEPEKTIVFRYEHPDLVREGIVFGLDQK